MAVMVAGGAYELVKARLDLIEAAAELDMARTASERAVAVERAEDARSRIMRWRRDDDD